MYNEFSFELKKKIVNQKRFLFVFYLFIHKSGWVVIMQLHASYYV